MRPFSFFVLTSVIVSLASFLSIVSDAETRPQARFEALMSQAAGFYQKGDFLSAHRVYQQAGFLAANQDENRRLKLHLSDTMWRLAPGPEGSERPHWERAVRELQALLEAADSERDEVWAGAHLSLGDFFSEGPSETNWSKASFHYQQALDWWTRHGREPAVGFPALGSAGR